MQKTLDFFPFQRLILAIGGGEGCQRHRRPTNTAEGPYVIWRPPQRFQVGFRHFNGATINNWQEALKVFDSIGDKTGVANMLSNQGAVYFNQGDDAKSLELHLQVVKIIGGSKRHTPNIDFIYKHWCCIFK